MVQKFEWNSHAVEVDAENNVRSYTLKSIVTIDKKTVSGSTRTFLQVNVQDIQASTGNPQDLYSGVLVGSRSNLSGQIGYNGVANLTCGYTHMEFVEPAYAAGPESTSAYYQSGPLTPLLQQ